MTTCGRARRIRFILGLVLSSIGLALACRFKVDVEGVPDEIHLRAPFPPPQASPDASDASDAADSGDEE